jgi:hypothetical protein
MLHCRGSLTLADRDGATLETVAGNLEVKVPLVGGAAEKAILGGLTRQLGLEAVALAAWCGR